MVCKNCGTPLDDGVKFCRECGQSVDTDVLTPPVKSYSPDKILEKIVADKYFYAVAFLCFCSIMTMFSKWFAGVTLFLQIKQAFEYLDLSLTGAVFACLYSIVMLFFGVLYGTALYKLYGVRKKPYSIQGKLVFEYVRKVSAFAISAFVLQLFIWLIVSEMKLSILFSFSTSAYAFLLFSIATYHFSKKGISLG